MVCVVSPPSVPGAQPACAAQMSVGKGGDIEPLLQGQLGSSSEVEIGEDRGCYYQSSGKQKGAQQRAASKAGCKSTLRQG